MGWPPCISLRRIATLCWPCCRPMVATIRGWTRTRPCRSRRCGSSRCSATPAARLLRKPRSRSERRPRALVTFYRSYLTAADTGPVDALIAVLREKGFDTYGVFVTSLKAAGVAEWLRDHLAKNPPAAIVNATAFSAIGDDGTTPFDGASCPVFQVALSTARREDWADALRGLSPGDLAMHVVLPEV